MIARIAPRSPSPRRRQAIGRKAKPSSRICSPCARTRVATTTSKPCSRAARATGRRCEQKYQSSVTRKRSFGRRPPSGAADGDGDDSGGTGSRRTTRVGPALRCDRRLFNAFAPRSLAPSGRRLRVGGSGLARILVTGAAGFIGDALCRGLVARGHDVLGITRGPAKPIPGVEVRPIGDISPRTDWSSHLTAAEIVIHLADRGAPEAARQAAAALARAAAASGVRRLVYMSSVRAMGAVTGRGAPFRPPDPPLPRDAYGRAKLASERVLLAVAQETGLELVILRPPLVYGPNVKANFRALIRLAASGLPLPLPESTTAAV